MKYRVFALVAVLVGGFVYATTVAHWNPRALFSSLPGPASTVSAPIWSGPAVAQGAGLSADEVNNVDIYKMAHPATVFITSTTLRQDWFLQVYPANSTGSGFLINDRGQILTNWHVVSGSQELTVTTTDKKNYRAMLLDKDPDNDLALIQIDPKGAKLPSLKLGDSDKVQIGQKVLAIGNPFGLEGTLTTGIVSSLARSIGDENGRTLEGLIQTDASINPGNSGGPLLDSQGNVIGINTAIYGKGGSIGIGFAMPVNRAREMLDSFASGRKYAPPVLGVTVLPIGGDLAEELGYPAEGGLLIQSIRRGSSAANAGIRGGNRAVVIGRYEVAIGGDMLVSINGRRAEDANSIPRALRGKRAGDTIEVELIRNGKLLKLKVMLQAATEERL